MKKYYTTFKLFGKKFGVISGGRLHFFMEWVAPMLAMLTAVGLFYIITCIAITYENTVLLP